MGENDSDEYNALHTENTKRPTQIVNNDAACANLKDKKYRFRDGLYQTFVSLGTLSVLIHPGITLSFATILHPQLTITKYQNAWIASLLSIGMPIGAILVGPLLDKIGRKLTSILAATAFAVSWVMLYFLPEDFDLSFVYAARLIGGIGSGLIISATVYISEVAHKRWRSIFLGLVSVFLSAGTLIVTTLGIVMPWRSFALFCFFASLVNIILILLMPESPHWLMKKRPERSKKALLKLNKNIQAFNEAWYELEQKQSQAQNNPTNWLSSLANRTVQQPIIRLGTVFTFQQLCGGYIVVVYGLEIFQSVIKTSDSDLNNQMFSNSSSSPLNTSQSPPTEGGQFSKHSHVFSFGDLDTICLIGVGIIRFATSVMTMFLSKFIGRRVMLISSSLGSAVFAFLFSISFSGVAGQINKTVSASFILIFLIFNAYGLLTIPWAQIGELIPISFRAKGSGIITAFIYIIMFIIMKIFPYVNDLIGISGMFLIFGFMSILAAVYVYYFIPETLGKPFSEIEAFFA